MKANLRRIFKIKLRKGDMVVVTRGRLKGQKGRVTAVHPTLNKISVESINMVKKPPQTKQGRTPRRYYRGSAGRYGLVKLLF